MDPVDPFNAGAWVRQYAAMQQGQRAGQRPHGRQSSFEQQIERLQLNSPDESTASSNSPDESPEARSGQIRPAELGGSMRLPSCSRPTDDSFSSARHSVDISHGRRGGATQLSPQSNLQEDLFSSARYALPEVQSAIEPKNSKRRGLWSRIKSGVGKAFGGNSSGNSSGSGAHQEFSSITFRADPAKQPARTRGLRDEDEAIIQEFAARATGNLSDGTLRNAVADLRALSALLSENRRPSIAARIDNPALTSGLDIDAETYAPMKKRASRMKTALNKLREARAGRALSGDIRRLNPYPADATLIDMWAAAEKATHRIEPETVDRQARRLSRLSDWLQTHNRGAMAGRLFTNGFAGDVEAYKRETQDTKIGPDLLRLGRYQQVHDANRELGRPPPEAHTAGPVPEQPYGAPHALPTTPASPSEGAWDLLREAIHGPSRSSSVPYDGTQPTLLGEPSREPRPSSSTPYRGPQFSAFYDLPATPATPSEGAWDLFRETIHGPSRSSSVPYDGTPPTLLREPSREPGPSSSTPYRGPQLSSFYDLPAMPATPSEGAWDLLRGTAGGPAPSSSARHPPSDIYGDLEVNLNPPTPHDLQHEGHSMPASGIAGPPSFVGPSGASQELRDIGTIVGDGWEHRSQPASDVLIDVLGNINLLPNQFGPSQFAINGERYSATLGPGGRRDVRLIHHPRARQTNEAAGPSQQPHHPPQTSAARASHEGAVDLGYLIRGGWEHRERFLPPHLVRALEGQHLMPDAENPTYFNIRGVPYRGELDDTGGRRRVRIYPERS
ncbi:hypothetical protein RX327_31385 [Bradyrhizobium sp. BEA-2-5]|uniref:hypothetical protein n=1 Tax=Bradyrhizobium sp. BEA-2-5 TaxID=3080015 RepID=UPI00293E82EA|nr:hypothetical protein [Bradyrhizobium sp. BEA-2-5]WOH80281.1 hypothetical protein RX327_31385 [Bradyrhizobium sp. BEA-2-5]